MRSNQILPDKLEKTQLDSSNRYNAAYKLIQEVDSVELALRDLNNYTRRTRSLIQQAEEFKKGRLIFPASRSDSIAQTNTNISQQVTHDALDSFALVIQEYSKLAERYQAIKSKAIRNKLISNEDAVAIEKSATNPLTRFFPLYESYFNEEYKKLAAIRANTPDYGQKVKDINQAYQGRKIVYKTGYAVTATISLFSMGTLLPTFLMVVVAQTFDKLITLIRAKLLKNQHNRVETNFENGVRQAKTKLENEIKDASPTNYSARFRQRFFELSQTAQTKSPVDISGDEIQCRLKR